MTVALWHNATLELNRAEYSGLVTVAELMALADFQALNPRWLSYDCLNIILPGADFDAIPFDALDGVFQKYRTLFEPKQFVIFRRSAWICQSAAAENHLHHWVGGRDTREGMSSDLRRCATVAEACEWLILGPANTAAAESGQGFDEIVRYTLPPKTLLAAAS